MENIEVGLSNMQIKTQLKLLEDEPNYFLKYVLDSKVTLEELQRREEYLERLNSRIIYTNNVCEYKCSKDMLQICSGKILSAFLNIYFGKFENAELIIDQTKAFINHCVTISMTDELMLENYKYGYEYLLELTEHYMKLKIDFKDDDFEFPYYLNLSEKGKAAVLSAKMMCFGNLLYQDDIMIVKELVEVDSDLWIWHYILCKRLRCNRRSNYHSGPSGPSEKESRAIITATNLVPKEYNMYCMASYCQCLAEILKSRFYNRVNGALVFDGRTFNSHYHIRDFIEQKCRDIRSYDKKGSGEYVRIGEIFSSILPKKFRNYSLAEECFAEAVNLKPRSSKIHHQFAKLYIDERNFTKAIEHLKLSVKYNCANLPTWTLLRRALNEDGRSNEFDAVLKNQINDPACPVTDNGNLQALRGYYLFLNGYDKEGGLKILIDSKLVHNDAWEVIKRFQWIFNKLEEITRFLDVERNQRLLTASEKDFIEFIKDIQPAQE